MSGGTSADLNSHAFHVAEMRSEQARIKAVLSFCISLFILMLIRGVMALAAGVRGEAWPFVVLLGALTAYELIWRRFVARHLERGFEISSSAWTTNLTVECLFPTAALVLQFHTPSLGPERALTSPVVMIYCVIILLSTLHLNPGMSRLGGVICAGGYVGAVIYAHLVFSNVGAGARTLHYAVVTGCAGLLLVTGAAAAAVAQQIRVHVLAAVREAEARAKLAEMERELEIARSIQQGLLPTAPPGIRNFDIAGWNRPAAETGGDYYDWQELADGRVALTIADVTGHGVGSALGMAVCRAYARAGYVSEPNLRSLICRLNELLYSDLPAEKFVTFVAALLHPEDGTLQLSSAGHGPLLFYSSAEDRFQLLDAQGPPLGLLKKVNYCGPESLKFARGDILILVTDGFLEWANDRDEDFGADRLMEVVRANRHSPAASIISELYSAVLRFAGSIPQADDLTALVVKAV